jgi:O-antigen ligase
LRLALVRHISPHLVLLPLLALATALACLALPLKTFLIALGGAAFLLLVCVNPNIGLYLTLSLVFVGTASYFKMIDHNPVRYLIYMALEVVTLFGLVVNRLISQKPLFPRSPFSKIVLGILICETAGLTWAPHLGFAWENLVMVISNTLLFYLTVVLVDTQEKLRNLALCFIVSGLVASGWLIASIYYDYTYTQHLSAWTGFNFYLYTERPGGLAGSNQVAGYLIFTSLCCAGLYSHYSSKWAKGLLALTGIYLFAISMPTGSRGALLGIIGGVAAFYALHPLGRRTYLKRIGLFLVVTLISILLLRPGFLDRILVGFGYTGEPIFSSKQTSSSNSAANVTINERLKWWGKGLDHMQEPPERMLVGLGPGGFVHYNRGVPEVHNLYLAFIFDMGLPGVVLMITFPFVLLGSVRRYGTRFEGTLAKRMFNAFLIALLSEAFIHGLVDYDLTSPVSRFIYLYLAMLAVSERLLAAQEVQALALASPAPSGDAGGAGRDEPPPPPAGPDPRRGLAPARGPAWAGAATCLLLAGAGGVAWAQGEALATLASLPVESATVAVTPLVPRAAEGQAVRDFVAAFPVRRLAAADGVVRLALTGDPICVEEGEAVLYPPQPGLRSPWGVHPATFRGEDPPFALARDLGLGWHRGATAWWLEIQSEEDIARGAFKFEAMDRELGLMPPGMEALVNIMLPERLAGDRARGAGMRPPGGGGPLGAPGPGAGPPPWMGGAPGRPPGGAPSMGPPGGRGATATGAWQLRHGEEAYLRFVRALATRYDGSHGPAVDFWQFENEPEMSRAGGDWEGYAHLQKITYQAIKEANPAAQVLMGGLAVDFPQGFDRFFAPALASLQGGYLDIFDFHHYGAAEDWRQLPALYANLRQGLDSLGYARVPIWMTECGTYSGQPARPPLPFQTEREQARSLVKRLTYALNLGAEKIFWAWGIMEGFHRNGHFFDHTGLVYDGQGPGPGAKKLAYHAFKMLNRKITGEVESLGRLDLEAGVVALAFRVEGRRVYVLWADGPAR